MDTVLNSPLYLLTLSLACFRAGLWLYRKSGDYALLHPTITGAAAAALILYYFDISYTDFVAGNQLLLFLLGPATVALAVPLYQQLHLIRSMAMPLLTCCISGAIFASVSAVAIGTISGADSGILASLSTKSITTPIAMAVSAEIGGNPSLAAGIVAFTSLIAIAIAPWIFKITGLADKPSLWGFCLGITAHGMGTARAFELNTMAGAFSSLAMCLTGTFTAIVIPLAALLLH